MVLVVAGPTKKRLAALVTRIVANGTKIDHRLLSAMTPLKPVFCLTYCPPMPNSFSPGYVAIIISGKIVCIVKKTGKMFCWRVENCGLGSAL